MPGVNVVEMHWILSISEGMGEKKQTKGTQAQPESWKICLAAEQLKEKHSIYIDFVRSDLITTGQKDFW